MKETYIGVKLVVEGLHSWPGVFQSEYATEASYLQSLHRHNFGIECQVKVNHNERDKEFICFKHEIISYLKQQFWNNTFQLCNFEGLSCESIAHILMEKFNLTMCKVDEDGENYAVVYKRD